MNNLSKEQLLEEILEKKLTQSRQSIKRDLKSNYGITRVDAEDLILEAEALIKYKLSNTVEQRIDDIVYKLEYLYESALAQQEEDLELARKILKDLKDIYMGSKVEVKANTTQVIKWIWNDDDGNDTDVFSEESEIT